MSRIPHRLVMITLALAGVAAVGACSASVHAGSSTGSLSKSTVENRAEAILAKQVGHAPDITCPHSLAAKKGATMRCVLVDPQDPSKARYGTTVTVTSVHGSTIDFHISVDEQPLTGASPS